MNVLAMQSCILISLLISEAAGFGISSTGSIAVGRPRRSTSSLLISSSVQDNHEEIISATEIEEESDISSSSADGGGSGGGGASLIFNCDSVFESESFPLASPHDIYEFFQQPATLKCMVSGGNQRDVEVTETTVGLLREWQARGRELGAVEPEISDTIVKVATSAMNFPGLSLTSKVVMGAKLLQPTSPGSYPVYEFTLIKDQRTAEGFGPAVWIFKKLTGADGTDDKDGKSSAPRTLSRATAVSTEDGQTIFQFNVDFNIEIKFPKVLLKILPVSKEKAEEQGSVAISKTLQKDIGLVMDILRQKYLEQ